MLPNDDPFEFVTGRRLLDEDRGPMRVAGAGCLAVVFTSFVAAAAVLIYLAWGA